MQFGRKQQLALFIPSESMQPAVYFPNHVK